MIYKNYVAKYKEKKKELPRLMKVIEKLSIYHVLMIFATPLLVQLRIFHPYYVNKIVSGFVSVGSNGKANFMIERMVGGVMGFGVR